MYFSIKMSPIRTDDRHFVLISPPRSFAVLHISKAMVEHAKTEISHHRAAISLMALPATGAKKGKRDRAVTRDDKNDHGAAARARFPLFRHTSKMAKLGSRQLKGLVSGRWAIGT